MRAKLVGEKQTFAAHKKAARKQRAARWQIKLQHAQ
jgi:hypothetical protein